MAACLTGWNGLEIANRSGEGVGGRVKRSKNALSPVSSSRRVRKSAKASTNVLPELLSPRLGLYGHTAWDVYRSGPPLTEIRDPSASEARKDPAQRVPWPGVGLPSATRRRREHRRGRWRIASSARRESGDIKSIVGAREEEQEFGFGISIGIANGIALEVALLMGGILVWCALSIFAVV